jgi:hypothetical protein
VFRGSFEAAESFRRARPEARPGAIGEAVALRCSSNYPGVGDRLLNRAYALHTIGDLRQRWADIQELIGLTMGERGL